MKSNFVIKACLALPFLILAAGCVESEHRPIGPALILLADIPNQKEDSPVVLAQQSDPKCLLLGVARWERNPASYPWMPGHFFAEENIRSIQIDSKSCEPDGRAEPFQLRVRLSSSQPSMAGTRVYRDEFAF
jgi:hypothetical protein